MDTASFEYFLNSMWVLIAAILVFVMQAGFMCLESGLTRRKNNINVAAKNWANLGVTIVLFWLFGYGLMFGQSGFGLIGLSEFSPDLLLTFETPHPERILDLAPFFLFQVMFCSTSVSILSGAAAERMRFGNFLIVSAIVSVFIYPLIGHWVWNGVDLGQANGWLGQRGFVDFAGGTVVHSVGGWVSLACILILRPRAGRFDEKGKAQPIPKSSLPLATLGAILLWFGWFGFNGGSTLSFSPRVALIMANTLLAGSAGLVTIVFIQVMIGRGTIEADQLINGTLGGLVAITASAHAVNSRDAFLIGVVGALSMFVVDQLLLRFQIDDAVGAIPVHLGGGLWGTLAVGIFGRPEILNTGLDPLSQIGIQFFGMLVVAAWAFLVSLTIFNTVDRFLPLRVSAEEEEKGLNISEHNALPDYSGILLVHSKDHEEEDSFFESERLYLPS